MVKIRENLGKNPPKFGRSSFKPAQSRCEDQGGRAVDQFLHTRYSKNGTQESLIYGFPPPPEEEEGGVGSCRPVPCGPTHIPPVGLGKARGLS